GGAGFIGSHVIRSWLAAHPDDVVVNLDALTYAGSRARLSDLQSHPHYRFIHGDICDGPIVRKAMDGIEVIVHCAAETHVDRSITNAAPFLRTNVEGTYTVLQEALTRGVKRFIHLSTDEVYGPVLEGTVDERAPLSPRSPYAASKAGGDLLVQAFCATYGVPTIVVRPTNIFGPAQLPEKFISLCITNTLEARPVPIYGDGQQRRGWLFVNDFCSALRTIIERGSLGEIYNVAGERECANVEAARAILAGLGRSDEGLQFVADRPGHDRRYAMSDAKLQALGWRPTTPFSQGVSETITWYRTRKDWWGPLAKHLREDPYHWLNRSSGAGAQPTARASR
ncbi:MAG: dTDP-glucose 4,6-dehydratase, partial [Candidatus Omnitrophota bacterium]|nr:dTDP-glucose 4,6-dehydratase [Candidatus Omnitrophota bacterium]